MSKTIESLNKLPTFTGSSKEGKTTPLLDLIHESHYNGDVDKPAFFVTKMDTNNGFDFAGTFAYPESSDTTITPSLNLTTEVWKQDAKTISTGSVKQNDDAEIINKLYQALNGTTKEQPDINIMTELKSFSRS